MDEYGLTKDEKTGLVYLEQSAESNEPFAIFTLLRIYQKTNSDAFLKLFNINLIPDNDKFVEPGDEGGDLIHYSFKTKHKQDQKETLLILVTKNGAKIIK